MPFYSYVKKGLHTCLVIILCNINTNWLILKLFLQYLDPVQSFWKIHGKTGVTDICSADDSIYTAGRDGHYRQFTIDNGQLQLLNSNRV